MAVPDVTLTRGSNSIDQTVFAAFGMLVALTAAQAGLLVFSIFHGVKQIGSVWAVVQVCHALQASVYTDTSDYVMTFVKVNLPCSNQSQSVSEPALQ